MSVFSTIFCVLSTVIIIQLAPTGTIYGLPTFEQTRITVQVGLIAAILAIILSLSTAQCIGINQVRQGILDDILILFISQGLMSIIYGGFNARKIFIYFYFLPTAITVPFLPRTRLLSTPTRKRKPRKRPKRDKRSAAVEDPENPLSLVLPVTTPSDSESPQPLPTATPSLIISDTILGYGSHKTVVFKGSFQGRPVAVKRFQQDFISLATHEVSILQQSDDHPNVIRYYYQEKSDPKFFYIALDLCPASLADIIENLQSEDREDQDGDRKREEWKDIARDFDAKKAMKQIASGLRHLHGLGLIHRDIKPQNILVSSSSSSRGRYRMLISDFGLCKKLDADQSSFLPACGDDKLNIATGDDTMSTTINNSSSGTSTTICLTKSVDIFALGCLFYYILSKGEHPYGNRFDREANIINKNKDLSLLNSNEEAHDLITHMLHRQPSQRPDIEMCLLHPFFWDSAKQLGFLRDASDRFEVMCKDPMDRALIRLERDAKSIFKSDWHQTLDQSSNQILINNLRQTRKYHGDSVRDLLRALRNKNNHYQDLPDDVKGLLGPMPEGFLAYFTYRYPKLLVYVHEVVKDTALFRESMFSTYFELPDT